MMENSENMKTNQMMNQQQPTWKIFRIPFLFILGLLALTYVPRIQTNPKLLHSFYYAGGALLIWMAWLIFSGAKSGKQLKIEPRLVRVHWVQAIVHLTLYAYWGYYWRPVYDFAPLLLAQILFSYAFVAFLSWSRGKPWQISFGIFPIIFSTNLFLWFNDDWFIFQFLMIALGYIGKEFIKWNRDGRRVHIFNPSGFSLSVFSLVLILTGMTHITQGTNIATTLVYPPYIYVYIFALGIVVQSLFSVTLTTLGAAIGLLALNLVYTKTTGVYWFFDANIPIAVFLGLHLLVTDPTTSPKTEFGRFIFGMIYGVAVFALAGLLDQLGVPGFYDKLLAVPFLNMSVQIIDRFVNQDKLAKFRLATFGLKSNPAKRNLVYMSVWIVIFAGMHVTKFTGRAHEGGQPAFWQKACEKKLPNGCRRLARMYEISCLRGNAKECNLAGQLFAEGKLVPQTDDKSSMAFGRSCVLGWQAGCVNAAIQYFVYDIPHHGEILISKITESCEKGHGQSCYLLGIANRRGKSIDKDLSTANTLFKKSCSLGFARGCRAKNKSGFAAVE
jgi:hypothetical protein